MNKQYILYNKLAGHGKTFEDVNEFSKEFDSPVGIDVTAEDGYTRFFNSVEDSDDVIVCGGDGTLNHFVNQIKDKNFNSKVFYHAIGSGNDFLRDIDESFPRIVEITKYVKDLPTVEINGMERAFINGKLSLTETEAISMLLEAESEAQVKLSREKSRKKLRESTDGIRAALVSVLSSVFARIDYPDEDLGDMTSDEVLSAINSARENVKALIATYKMGRAVTLGVPTVICGKPNVGKSTLYNLLVGENAAIVTDIPGTTRDVLEKSISLGNVLLKLWDTAGIREGEVDAVEAIGIERSRERIAGADLIFALFDSSEELDSEDRRILDFLAGSNAVKIAIFTKNDINYIYCICFII